MRYLLAIVLMTVACGTMDVDPDTTWYLPRTIYEAVDVRGPAEVEVTFASTESVALTVDYDYEVDWIRLESPEVSHDVMRTGPGSFEIVVYAPYPQSGWRLSHEVR